MASPDFAEFIRLLDLATERQQAHWEPTKDEDCFQVRVGPGVMRLTRSTYRNAYVLELIDHQDKVVEQYESTGEEEIAHARALFKKGRMKALNLEHVIEGFFNNVKAAGGGISRKEHGWRTPARIDPAWCCDIRARDKTAASSGSSLGDRMRAATFFVGGRARPTIRSSNPPPPRRYGGSGHRPVARISPPARCRRRQPVSRLIQRHRCGW